MRVALAGNENWPFQIFMEIGAADTAPSDINQHLVRACGRTVDVLYPNVFLIVEASCSHGHGDLLESIHNARISSPLIVSRPGQNRNSDTALNSCAVNELRYASRHRQNKAPGGSSVPSTSERLDCGYHVSL